MVAYIDSSFLLSIIFEEDNSELSGEIWKNCYYRMSSLLLEAECLVTLRRFYSNERSNLAKNWLPRKEKELSDLLAEVNLRTVDRTITEYISIKDDLCGCRTLDAIHLATALEFADNSGSDIKICTYDKNMRKIAQKMNFSILPVEN